MPTFIFRARIVLVNGLNGFFTVMLYFSTLEAYNGPFDGLLFTTGIG